MKTDSIRKFVLVAISLSALLVLPVFANAQTEPGKPSMKHTPTKKRPVKKAVPPLVAIGTDLKIRINETLSSKNSRVGDQFTGTVLTPSRYEEARVFGHISSIKKSGKVQGRTSMNLAFDSVQLRDGRRGKLHGYVTRVYGDNAGQADNEGGVESGSRGKQTVKRGGIAALTGAVIGGIAGGGKGAAIGLLVGGAAGAGSLAVKGSKELKIEAGTEMLVRVTH